MPAQPLFPIRSAAATVVFTALILAGGIVGCGSYEEPKGANEIIGTADETVSAPDAPTGKVVADVNESVEFTTGGAKSSRGHSLEYRFDFDAVGGHDFSGWSASSKVQKSFSQAGTPVIKAQARCQQHPHIASSWSEGFTIMVGQGPETEIVRVINSYRVAGELQEDEVDFNDAVPDTVPYGSWITVFYTATDTTEGGAECNDPMNKCLAYQKRFSRDSARIPGSFSQTSWLPSDREDTNPFGVKDSTSMNIGSVEYVFQARGVDVYDRRDGTPAQISIVGNFDPTLDGTAIENHTGETIGDGDTLIWDWWEPADSGIVVQGSELMKTKTFYFVIKATGHDHPKERDGAGVYSWFYEFANVGAAGTTPFAHSGQWVDGVTVNALNDTFTWVAVYPESDINGDEIFVNDPPVWNGKSFDFSIMGRDLPEDESFSQKMFVNGQSELVNQYATGELGRWTPPGGFRWHMTLRR